MIDDAETELANAFLDVFRCVDREVDAKIDQRMGPTQAVPRHGPIIESLHHAGFCEDGKTFSVWFNMSDGSIAACSFVLGESLGEGVRLLRRLD